MATIAREQVKVEGQAASSSRLTNETWREIEKASFAVLSYVTPSGEPRSSGVVYGSVGHRLYVAVAANSWKAKHIALSGRVSVTVPVRHGGVLTLLFPIPPATISFRASASVRATCASDLSSISHRLARLLPPSTTGDAVLIELTPRGDFLTFGIGVPLLAMRNRSVARGKAPVAA